MTVKELIEALEKIEDKASRVIARDSDGTFVDVERDDLDAYGTTLAICP